MIAPVVLRIDSAMRGNRVIFWLGRIPLIRRLVSDRLYSADEGKLALSVLVWAWRVLRSLGGKVLYLALMLVLPLLTTAGEGGLFSESQFGRFCWLLLILSFVVGALLNPCAVTADELKYTCVRMMGMNARRCHLWSVLAHHLEYLIGFALWLSAASALFGQGGSVGLLLAFEMACARLFFEWFHLWVWDKRGKTLHGRPWFVLTVIAVGLIAAYAVGLALPAFPAHRWLISLPAGVAALAVGGLSLWRILRFDRWYRLTLTVCTADRISPEIAKQGKENAQFVGVRLKESDLTMEEQSDLTGWPYLQDLFFRRHSRMVYKPMRWSLIIIAALTVIGGVACPFLDAGDLFDRVTAVLPYFVFVLYIIQSNIMGTVITKAMFHNCDLAMLKFGWYRQPAVVLKNFVLRFRRLCRVNLTISAALCVMITVLTLCAGGRPPLTDYLAFMLALLALGVFFAVHSLGMYYLFQPYTAELQMKNPFFGVINGVMYVVCYSCVQIRSTPGWFTMLVLVVTVLYSAVILLAVRLRSPRTFRVK